MRGTTVILYEETVTGQDPFGVDIIEETPVEVKNVLIGEPSTDDITSSVELYGKQIKYVLAIPKGDTHDWMDKRVFAEIAIANASSPLGAPPTRTHSPAPRPTNKAPVIAAMTKSIGPVPICQNLGNISKIP